jgi:hypothetical protein
MQVSVAASSVPVPAQRTDVLGSSESPAASQPGGHLAGAPKTVSTVPLPSGGRPDIISAHQSATPSVAPVRVTTVSAEEGEVRTVPERAKESGELAFTAELTAVSHVSDLAPGSHQQPQLLQKTPRPEDVRTGSNTLEAPSRQQEPNPIPAVHETTSTTERTNPERHREEQAKPSTIGDATHTSVLQEIPASVSPAITERTTVQSQRESIPDAPRTEPEIKTELHPELPRPQAATHEIRLELAGNNHRVELKVSDREGEVKIAVRTADNHLADRLRDNLPTLSSRLAENGIRSQTWHPASASSEGWRHSHETATGHPGDTQDAHPQQQDREQRRDHAPKRPRVDDDKQTKEKGKDFEWLLSTMH